jgi:hypothetical protein
VETPILNIRNPFLTTIATQTVAKMNHYWMLMVAWSEHASKLVHHFKPENQRRVSKEGSMPKLMTEKETAVMVGMSVHWLRRKRWEGGGIPFKNVQGGSGPLFGGDHHQVP